MALSFDSGSESMASRSLSRIMAASRGLVSLVTQLSRDPRDSREGPLVVGEGEERERGRRGRRFRSERSVGSRSVRSVRSGPSVRSVRPVRSLGGGRWRELMRWTRRVVRYCSLVLDGRCG